MARNRSLTRRGITALQGLGQPDQLADEALLLVVGQERVEPVVDDGSGDHHAARRAAGVVAVGQLAPLQQGQRGLDRLASQLPIAVDQILDRVPLQLEGLAAPRQALQLLDDRGKHRVFASNAELGRVGLDQLLRSRPKSNPLRDGNDEVATNGDSVSVGLDRSRTL